MALIFFGFCKFNLDYDQNFTEKKKKKKQSRAAMMSLFRNLKVCVRKVFRFLKIVLISICVLISVVLMLEVFVPGTVMDVVKLHFFTSVRGILFS